MSRKMAGNRIPNHLLSAAPHAHAKPRMDREGRRRMAGGISEPTPLGAPPMKTLTLTQPWATLVALGAKRIETRSWRTSYRGPLAIHAAKRMPKAAISLCWDTPFRAALEAGGYGPGGGTATNPFGLPLGAVIAVTVLIDVQC